MNTVSEESFENALDKIRELSRKNGNLESANAELLEALEDCINLIGQIGATAEQIKIVRSAEKSIRRAKGEEDNIDDLVAGLERAADLFDDIQERKAKGEPNE